jgi:hypothetical protein
MNRIQKVGNFDNPGGVRVLEQTRLGLHKSVIYFLSEEKRFELREWYLEDFAAAIYLLAVLVEHFEVMPGMEAAEVRRWREVYFSIYDAHYSSGELRNNIMDAFTRLEEVTERRPPSSWKDLE